MPANVRIETGRVGEQGKYNILQALSNFRCAFRIALFIYPV